MFAHLLYPFIFKIPKAGWDGKTVDTVGKKIRENEIKKERIACCADTEIVKYDTI